MESLGGNQLLKELSSRTNEAKHLNNASLLSGGVQEALDLLISHALLNKQEKAEMAGELQSMKEDISTGNTQVCIRTKINIVPLTNSILFQGKRRS